MGYGVLQSYGFSLPTESVDGQKLWVITEYGLLELWVKTELTVESGCGGSIPDLVQQVVTWMAATADEGVET